MFDLVADVESYPSFIPWCQALRIISRPDSEQKGVERYLADMVVGFRLFREQFRSDVLLNKDEKLIDTRYVRGPMRHMRNQWRFEDDGKGGAIVKFEIDFSFKNPLLQGAAQTFFDEAFSKMASAFEKRAHEVYGSQKPI